MIPGLIMSNGDMTCIISDVYSFPRFEFNIPVPGIWIMI
ncbi:hypothetical protein JSMCR1_4169 [Escherichia coli]|nr:hypothetical protein JSMCR1_4169 [Escherichia coli]